MDVLQEWYEAQQQLQALKEKEARLRKLVAESFDVEKDFAGTKKRPLGNGWTLEASWSLTYKVLPDVVEELMPELLDKGIDPRAVVRWKPELDKRNYNALTPEQQQVMNLCMEVKQGMPTMKVVAPKGVAQ